MRLGVQRDGRGTVKVRVSHALAGSGAVWKRSGSTPDQTVYVRDWAVNMVDVIDDSMRDVYSCRMSLDRLPPGHDVVLVDAANGAVLLVHNWELVPR